MTHFIDITFADARTLCTRTSTPLPGVGEFREISFRNVKLQLINTGHRLIEVSSQLPPSILFIVRAGEHNWSLRRPY